MFQNGKCLWSESECVLRRPRRLSDIEEAKWRGRWQVVPDTSTGDWESSVDDDEQSTNDDLQSVKQCLTEQHQHP